MTFNIRIPSSTSEDGHSFDFSLSTNTEGGPQGSFECIQQCGARSLESAGPLSYKMRIKANDDVFVQTQHRFNELEQERKSEWYEKQNSSIFAKEIKNSCTDLRRNGNKKIGLPPIPRRREKSPSYNSHQSKHPAAPNFANTSNSHKLPNGFNSSSATRKVVNGLSNTNAAPPTNGTASKNGVVTGTQDVSRRPLKERLIHMLAVKPYKKPELFQRLHSDGIKDRDKKVFMTILQQITSFKDNEYSLLRGVWNDVQEDWPYYSDQERQLMKRRKPQNLTPPGSDSSVGSGTSSLSPRSNSSIGSGHSPTNYTHSSNYIRPMITTNGSGDINYKGLTPPDGGFETAKAIKRPVPNGILPENCEDYKEVPQKKKPRVSHFKKPGSGGSSNGNGANSNFNSRTEIVKQDKDVPSGSSPQFSSHSSRIAERLSPIGTCGNFSAQNGSNGGGGVGQNVNNHRSPRNGNFEAMDVSPSHLPSNGYHASSQADATLEVSEAVVVGSSWQSRNGNEVHGLPDCEKGGRADSDETDSVDSGNGSSTSGSSQGSQHQSYSNGQSNNNVQGTYTNGTSAKLPVDKSDSIASSVYNTISNSSITNGCNRVSSTTNFHTTPQSSPDSQVDNLAQQKCQSINFPTKHNQRANGKCNLESTANVEIVVTREKGSERDAYRERERAKRNDKERDRCKDKERDSRPKDRMKRSGDKKFQRITEECDRNDIDNDEVKITSDYPSYITKYITINNSEQRSKYKEDFNIEYSEYRDLHAVIDKVSKRFAHLEERLRQEERGTEGYEEIKEQIVNEYYANKRNKKYQDTRQKFQYLHEKLSHIKRLVADYDAHHQDTDMSQEFNNNFRN
ncbi:RNA polymerase II elongation factor Ell [Orchesella cincta]|uniref:RNA polymerase II elongation factor Ell n=1 Tax=Orchesella cincta TaxID=48709 RepID=A0A1D2MZH4_ORCCI|nr:RNA polymerase II elongation factor Ell [Orchesella cincta]